MMRLLLVTGRFPVRSETFIYRKAVALAQRGHLVHVLTRADGEWELYPAPLPANLSVEVMPADTSYRQPGRIASAAAGIARNVLRSPRGAQTAWRSRTGMREFVRYLPFAGRDADVIHFEFLSLAALYPRIAEVTRVPTVVSCRGQDLHTLELRPPQELERGLATLRSASGIHCVSQEMADHVTRLIGVRSNIVVNRPAVDTTTIEPRVSAQTAAELRLLATGRLVWKKGFDYLLAAIRIAVRAGVKLHLDILGDGELRDVLTFAIEDMGLADVVSLIGGVSSGEVLDRMRSVDVFLLPSVEEGISNAVLEAMASGVPVVTTNAGGMAEAVTDGVEGFVIPVRDPVALADRIVRLARDGALRERMGAAASARARRDFSLQRQADVFERLYASLPR